MPLHNESFETRIMREQQEKIKEQAEQIAALTARIRELKGALDKIIHEIGIPRPGYIQPVANAYEIAKAALEGSHET